MIYDFDIIIKGKSFMRQRNIIKKQLVRIALEELQYKSNKNLMNVSKDEPIEGVVDTLNIAYINRNEVPLAMDIFEPTDHKGEEIPVMIYVHGGGLVVGSRTSYRNLGRYYAKLGCLVFSIEYRLAPLANACEQLDDVCAGLDLIGRKLPEYDVDYTRIYMAAESAGAFLATYVTAMTNSKRLQDAIGYKPSKFRFKSLALFGGMFYTQRRDPIGALLADQMFGDKELDEKFLEYMNPEHPEILNNLPPVYLITSRGDILNKYTLDFHKAIKKNGGISRLVYYGDKELGHAFPALQFSEDISKEAIRKSLEWMEKQVVISKEKKMQEKNFWMGKIENEDVCKQKMWKFIKEMNSSEECLDATAIISKRRNYTYRQMFRNWEKYAEAFSGIGICKENNSRVGIIAAISAASSFAFYGLNMVGAEIAGITIMHILNLKELKKTFEFEKLTDLLVDDIMLDPVMFSKLMEIKEELGIRNIIIINTEAYMTDNPIQYVFDMKRNVLRKLPGIVYMDELLNKYEAYPIKYADYRENEVAIILHSTGTTKGIPKPMPFSDESLNYAALRYMKSDVVANLKNTPRILSGLDYASAYFVFNMTHMPFCIGANIVMCALDGLVEGLHMQIHKHRPTIVLTNDFQLYPMMMMPGFQNADFSSVEFFAMGGAYLSAERKAELNAMLAAHNSSVKIINGYGLSEAGAGCILSTSDCEDDSIGFPMYDVDVLIMDEDTEEYYTLEDTGKTGAMLISSHCLSLETLDDNVLYEAIVVEGKKYINTFDAVKINEDKSLTYIGRMNRFFVNNDGIKFDAGLVETSMSSQNGISGCALVPQYGKEIHDTVPVLYVKTRQKGQAGLYDLKAAFINVYTNKQLFETTNLPARCVIVDDLPLNRNGKIDVYRVTKEEVPGHAYDIIPVMVNGKLKDINFVPSLNSRLFVSKPVELDDKFAFFNINYDEESVDPRNPFLIFLKNIGNIQVNNKGGRDNMNPNKQNFAGFPMPQFPMGAGAMPPFPMPPFPMGAGAMPSFPMPQFPMGMPFGGDGNTMNAGQNNGYPFPMPQFPMAPAMNNGFPFPMPMMDSKKMEEIMKKFNELIGILFCQDYTNYSYTD